MVEVGRTYTNPEFTNDGNHVILVEKRVLHIARTEDFIANLQNQETVLTDIPFGTVAYFGSAASRTICVLRPASIWTVGVYEKIGIGAAAVGTAVFTGVKIPVPHQLYVFRVDSEGTIFSKSISSFFISSKTLFQDEIRYTQNWLPNTYPSSESFICGGEEINKICGERKRSISARVRDIIFNRETNTFNSDLSAWQNRCTFVWSKISTLENWNASNEGPVGKQSIAWLAKPRGTGEVSLIKYLNGLCVRLGDAGAIDEITKIQEEFFTVNDVGTIPDYSVFKING